jgi:hypothetical protein
MTPCERGHGKVSPYGAARGIPADAFTISLGGTNRLVHRASARKSAACARVKTHD